MGPTSPITALLFDNCNDGDGDSSNNNNSNDKIIALDGMAIMSTHPRDYNKILDLCYNKLPSACQCHHQQRQRHQFEDAEQQPLPTFVPCLGIHPWFVNELTDSDWELVETSCISTEDNNDDDKGVLTSSSSSSQRQQQLVPKWVNELETRILMNPPSSQQPDKTSTSNTAGSDAAAFAFAEQRRISPIVGEIGLDKFQFNPVKKTTTDDNGNEIEIVSKELLCPMEKQIVAFQYQLELATKLQKPVSVHCVHAMGPLVDTIRSVKKKMNGRLPPCIYFHAFGGKEASIDQLTALITKPIAGIGKKKQKNFLGEQHRDIRNKSSAATASSGSGSTTTQIYFGFAPVVNFRSPKTANVVRKVGLHRLVLETDHEDASRVSKSMIQGIEYLSEVLNVTSTELIIQTTKNSYKLYGIE